MHTHPHLRSGGSEVDFDAGMKANLDSTKFMLDKLRTLQYERPPVFLYTSSGAVYGGEIKDNTVTDDTVPAPQGSYGIQKLVGGRCRHLLQPSFGL